MLTGTAHDPDADRADDFFVQIRVGLGAARNFRPPNGVEYGGFCYQRIISMRFLPTLAVLGAAISVFGFNPAHAAAGAIDPYLGSAASRLIVPVRVECSPVSCIDSRTGAYTQSGCNGDRCYPTSGVIGYTNPAQAHEDWRRFHWR